MHQRLFQRKNEANLLLRLKASVEVTTLAATKTKTAAL
jgi:hypothetical protein